MKKIPSIIIATLAFLLASCSQTGGKNSIDIKGTWILESIQDRSGENSEYPQNDISWLRIYDDSCYYQCRILNAPTGIMIVPDRTGDYTLLESGKDSYIYMQEDGKHPFAIESDSTITIQEVGCKYTWKVCNDFDEEKIMTIVGIVKNDVNHNGDSANRYVFSYAEDKLKTNYHVLFYILIIVLAAGTNYIFWVRKQKKRIEQELRMIEQELRSIPEPVLEAMNSVEEDFHMTDLYISIRNKITNGEHLTEDDWKQIDEKFKNVYPRFNTTLMNVCNISQTELQVCVLLKLNSTPSEIANVLCKDISSISSIRSRLYNKYFGKKGGSKDWDDFIHSL